MAQARIFRVAGRVVATHLAGDDLAPFELPNAPLECATDLEEPPPVRDRERLVFRGEGWIVDRDRPVECQVDPDAYRIWIGGVGSFWVKVDGRSLGCSRMTPGVDPRLAQQALLGPAITLALALQGTFCLHASAIESRSGVLAFAGESGAGKSTLARLLIGSPVGEHRAADDILALDMDSGRPMASKDFPQLKLAPAEQPCVNGPSSLPLRAVFLLQPPPSSGLRRAVRLEQLSAKDSMLALVRHTVATRLFDARLLERHLSFCAAIAERIRVRRLVYPWEPQWLPRIAEAIGRI